MGVFGCDKLFRLEHSKYYQLIPIVMGCVTIIIVVTLIQVLHGSFDYITVLESRALNAITHPTFKYSIYFTLGILIPFGTDHIFNFPNLISMDAFIRMESFLLPSLVILMQAINIYFLCETQRAQYLWNYYTATYVELIALYNCVMAIQANLAQKYPDMVTAVFFSTLFTNIGIIVKVAALVDGSWHRGRYSFWILLFLLSFMGKLYVAKGWMDKYLLSRRTGLKNQPFIYAFCKMTVLLIFIVGYCLLDLNKTNRTMLGADANHLVSFNALVIGLFYFTSEISYRRTKNLAKFSVEALETKRAFVRYVSHEIRTPMNTACLGLQLLQKEVEKLQLALTKRIAASSRDSQQEERPVLPNTIVKKTNNVFDETSKNYIMELIGDTSQACNIAVEILNDLLMYEKIDGGLLVLDAVEISLEPFVQEVMKLFMVQARALELELVWDCNLTEDVYITVDSYKLSQVLRNLISNALKFSPAGSKVKVTAEILYSNRAKSILLESKKVKAEKREVPTVNDGVEEEYTTIGDLENQHHKSQYPILDRMFHVSKENSTSKSMFHAVDMIRISVIDCGAGISKENQKRLFHEVVQFNAAKLQEGKGSGIGLWISNKIMKLHGGGIGVFSEGEGNGSTFYVNVPITKIRARAKSLIPLKSEGSGISVIMRGLSILGGDTHDARNAHHTPAIVERKRKPSILDSLRGSHSDRRVGSNRYAAPEEMSNRMAKGNIHESFLLPTIATTHNTSMIDAPPRLALPTSQAKVHPEGTVAVDSTHIPSGKVIPIISPSIEKSILIVDDSAVNRKMIKRSLVDSVNICHEAVNGKDCIEKVKHAMQRQREKNPHLPPEKCNGYDVIITDYFMPEMNGLEAVQILRQEIGYHGKVIGLTGNTEQQMVQGFLDAGVDKVVTKPFQAQDLQTLINIYFDELTNER